MEYPAVIESLLKIYDKVMYLKMYIDDEDNDELKNIIAQNLIQI